MLTRIHTDECGHGGAALASLLGIAAAIVLVVAIAAGSDGLAIAGAILVGLGIVIAVQAPHIWLRRLYTRLDRIQPDDPEVRPHGNLRIEF